jgi:mono/diheme cytochrome c family protein
MSLSRVPRCLAFVVLAIGLASIAISCSRGNPSSAADDRFTEARQIFQANCFRCHSIAGQMEHPSRNPLASSAPGPDLAKVGANPEHSVEWLMGYIRNPKSVKTNSRMPPYEGKMSDEDLKSIAEFLSSLK